jgi:hypothetical protein
MTQLPHAFKRIRLELARSKEFPNGSANHGYELVAPLDADAHIDAALWQKYRENCRVSRFWGDGEEIGYLLHKPGGPEHARWVFDYHKTGRHEDEYGYRFGSHSFRFGEYVSIQDEAGETPTFRVVSVTPVV